MIPKYWVPGLEAIVEWEIDPNPKAELKRDRYGSLDMQDYRRHAKITRTTRRLLKYLGMKGLGR